MSSTQHGKKYHPSVGKGKKKFALERVIPTLISLSISYAKHIHIYTSISLARIKSLLYAFQRHKSDTLFCSWIFIFLLYVCAFTFLKVDRSLKCMKNSLNSPLLRYVSSIFLSYFYMC